MNFEFVDWWFFKVKLFLVLSSLHKRVKLNGALTI
jgi:hypothetical protein